MGGRLAWFLCVFFGVEVRWRFVSWGSFLLFADHNDLRYSNLSKKVVMIFVYKGEKGPTVFFGCVNASLLCCLFRSVFDKQQFWRSLQRRVFCCSLRIPSWTFRRIIRTRVYTPNSDSSLRNQSSGGLYSFRFFFLLVLVLSLLTKKVFFFHLDHWPRLCFFLREGKKPVKFVFIFAWLLGGSS